MKTIPREQLLLSCALVLSAGALLFGSVRSQQRQTLTADIGRRATPQAEERDALQRLSLELTKHPEAKSIQIRAGRDPWRQATMGFIRVDQCGRKNILWMDNRFSSAAFKPNAGVGIRETVTISEEPIHAAAHHLSTYSDANRYDDQLREARAAGR